MKYIYGSKSSSLKHFIYDPNYLMHHGIKGQKWGVRRFQNEDGSLTPEGRARYDDYRKDGMDHNKAIAKIQADEKNSSSQSSNNFVNSLSQKQQQKRLNLYIRDYGSSAGKEIMKYQMNGGKVDTKYIQDLFGYDKELSKWIAEDLNSKNYT